jgi:cytochrome d ubiquinol oxidase subunit I
VPADDRPPLNTLLHWSFDTMVGICSVLILLGLWFVFLWWRKRDVSQSRWFLRATAVSGIASVIALECGWIVTEVGRQPWIVYNVMHTADAVTQADGIWLTFALIVGLYVVLGATLVITLRAMSLRWRTTDAQEDEGPYGPDPRPPADLAAGASG